MKQSPADNAALIYAVGGWEIRREDNTLWLWARYRIKDSDRIVKGDSGWVVKGDTGLLHDDYESETDEFEIGVTNQSEVNANGWRDPDADLGGVIIYVNPDTGDNANDGTDIVAPKQYLYDNGDGHGGLSALRDLQAGYAHQLLVAEGTTQTFPTNAFQIEQNGAAFNKKVYVGTYAAGVDDGVRPIINVDGGFVIEDDFDYVHVQGLQINVTGNSGSARYLGSKANVSFQDLYINGAMNVMANVVDRCILVPLIPESGEGQNVMIALLNGDSHLISDVHVVNSPDIPNDPDHGHGVYEGVDRDNPPVPPRTIYRRVVFLRVYLQDMHRSRDLHDFLNLYQCIQDNCGNGSVGGVNDRGYQIFNARWDPDPDNKPTAGLNSQSQQTIIYDNDYGSAWEPAPGSMVEIRAGMAPPGFYLIDSVTLHESNPDTITLHGEDVLGDDVIASGIYGLTGDGPWRVRNRTFRHLVSLNTGSYEGAFSAGDASKHTAMIGCSDVSGFWLSESICTVTRNDFTGAPYAAVSALGHKGSADGLAELLDIHVENLTLPRLTWNGILLSGQSSGESLGVCRWVLCETLNDARDTGCIVYVGQLEPPSSYFESSDSTNQNWDIDENVYAGPQAGGGMTGGAFHYTGRVTNNQQDHLATWRTHTTQGGNGQDVNSVANADPEEYWALGPTQSVDLGYQPGLADYDNERPTGLWPVSSGSQDTRLRLANALEERPLRQWDANLTAEAMVRWTLRQYKAWPSGWPSLPAGRWIGATNYTMDAPELDTPTHSSLTVSLAWSNVGLPATRYIIRYQKSGTDAWLEQEVWDMAADSLMLTVPSSGTWTFKVVASDGWSESEESNAEIVTV